MLSELLKCSRVECPRTENWCTLIVALGSVTQLLIFEIVEQGRSVHTKELGCFCFVAATLAQYLHNMFFLYDVKLVIKDVCGLQISYRFFQSDMLLFNSAAEANHARLFLAVFSFDQAHRVASTNGGSSCQYFYDGAGRRAKAIRNGVTTKYIYGASGDLLAEVDGATNSITKYYIYGNGLIASIKASSTAEVNCYHFDFRGNTVAITDSWQETICAYGYGPFGEAQVVEKDATVDNPFTFCGQHGVMQEPDGIYYMRARYYDSETGRFISEDPLGLAGGDVTLYNYANNNPAVFIDPLGLCASSSITPKDVASYFYLASDITKEVSSKAGIFAAGTAVLSIIQPELLPIAGTAGSVSLGGFALSQGLGAVGDILSYDDPTIPLITRATILGAGYFMSKTSSGTVPETLAKGLFGTIVKSQLPKPAN
jgi:RHS repeat-associated protein